MDLILYLTPLRNLLLLVLQPSSAIQHTEVRQSQGLTTIKPFTAELYP